MTAVWVFIISFNNIKAKLNTQELHQEMKGIILCSVATTQWQSGKASGYWQQLIPLDREQAASTSLFVFCIFLEAKDTFPHTTSTWEVTTLLWSSGFWPLLSQKLKIKYFLNWQDPTPTVSMLISLPSQEAGINRKYNLTLS